MNASGGVQPVFFYDLGDPDCYLTGERIMGELPVVPEWEPVLAADLDAAVDPTFDRIAFEGRAAFYGLQPVRWPAVWPGETRPAMLTATYAKHVGRAVAFSLAAFRQIFAAGRDPDDPNTALLAAAACEMHPNAVLKGIEMKSVARALGDAAARASELGIAALPAIAIGVEVFSGPDALQEACAALEGRT